MRKWIPYLLIIAAVVASIVVYPRMPERVPTHWNMAGEVDGWSSRFFAAWLSPVMMAVMLVILRALPHIDPRRANYAKFSGMYEALIMVTMAFMLGIHLMLLSLATGSQVPVARVIPAAVGVFFMIIGAMLPRAHPNWFVGIRTPWTLTSDASWQKTHRLGGALFIASVVGAAHRRARYGWSGVLLLLRDVETGQGTECCRSVRYLSNRELAWPTT
jgi:uncharacterized membrane protein